MRQTEGRAPITRIFILLLLLAVGIFIFFLHDGFFLSDHVNGVNDGNTGAEKKDIVFTFWGNKNEQAALEKCILAFEANYPDIHVRPVHIPKDSYMTEIISMYASEASMDIGYIEPDAGYSWAADGRLYDFNELEEMDASLREEDFLDNIWYNRGEEMSVGPSHSVECLIFLYNKKLAEEANLLETIGKAEEAWNWDQFMYAAQKLTMDENGNDAFSPRFNPNKIQRFGFCFPYDWAVPYAFIHANGGKYTNQAGSRLLMTAPGAVDALDFLSALVSDDHAIPDPVQAKELPDPVTCVQSEMAAMAMAWSSEIEKLSGWSDRIGIKVMPGKNNSLMYRGDLTVIFRKSEYPEEALKLYRWLMDPDCSPALYESGLRMPVLKKFYSVDHTPKWLDAAPEKGLKPYESFIANQFFSNSFPSPEYYLRNFDMINEAVQKEYTAVWTQGKAAKTAMEDAKINTLINFIGKYGNGTPQEN